MIPTTIFIILWLIAMCGWVYCLRKWQKANQERLIYYQAVTQNISDKRAQKELIENLQNEIVALKCEAEVNRNNERLRKQQEQRDEVDAQTDDLIRRFRIKAYTNRKDHDDFEWYLSLRAWFRRFASFGKIYLAVKGSNDEIVKPKEYEIGEQTRQLILSAINNKLVEIESKTMSNPCYCGECCFLLNESVDGFGSCVLKDYETMGGFI